MRHTARPPDPLRALIHYSDRADYRWSKGMNNDRINLGRRKQEGTPKCQINLKNRKAAPSSPN